jgi:hypothetical protein
MACYRDSFTFIETTETNMEIFFNVSILNCYIILFLYYIFIFKDFVWIA